MAIKLSQEQFIIKVEFIHQYKYDYSMIEYINTRSKIIIICKDHGSFSQLARLHMEGKGCPKCAGKIGKLNLDQFKDLANEKHTFIYDYNNIIKFNSVLDNIIIECKKHGKFNQRADRHLSGNGCPRCAHDIQKKKVCLSLEEFIEKSVKIHKGLYDYSKIEWKNTRSKVSIICTKHGAFKQSPHVHMAGHGCPDCNLSKGELCLIEYFKENAIEYIKQKKFPDCTNPYTKNKLRFDFYLPNQNTCVEFDGPQHFKVIDYFGGYSGFEKRQFCDRIKNEYCQKQGIKLIRISDISHIPVSINSLLKK